MGRLHRGGKHRGDLALVRLHKALQVRVERRQQKAVRANQPRDQIHHEQPDLKALVRLAQLGKQLFGERLRDG